MQTEIIKDIFYVGAQGDNAKSDFFDSPPSQTAYNAYLIKGEKTALIETTHGDFADDFIQKIEEIIPLSQIDYLICNYTGTEYIESVIKILKKNPQIEVVATIPAIKNLKGMTNMTFNEHIVKNGEKLELGNGKTLEFMIAPCLPWQDTMLTYLPECGAVFSGRMFASKTAFDDASDSAVKDYYNEILSPRSAFVRAALKLMDEKSVKMIFPSHGAPVTDDAHRQITQYYDLCKKDACADIAVFCSEDNKNTARMAHEIVKTLRECNMSVSLYDINRKDAVNALNTADALIFGTPTINKNASKKMWQFLSEIDAVNAKGKPYFVFGSYGWSGEGCELVHRFLVQLRLRPFAKPLCAVFTPSDSELKNISDYTRRFLKSLENI